MKTVLHTARNHVLNLINLPEGERKLVPSTEVVITLTEPKYAVIEGEKIAKYPDCETVRFQATAKSLRMLSEEFKTYADELEEAFELFVGDEGDEAPVEPEKKAGPTVEELLAEDVED